MEKYIQIIEGKVNPIIVENDKINELKAHGLEIIDVTNITPQPQVGWIYDGVNFNEAPVTPPTREALRENAKATRDQALQGNTYALSDGSEYQVRPADLPIFQTAVQANVDQDWVLADNSVRLTTVAEMQEILSAGVAQATAIWKTYTDTLKNIG